MSKIVCRTCLVANNRMHDIRNTPLQEIFEKLTSTKLSSEDGRSKICYICYSQLHRCNRFLDMARQADKMFRQVYKKGIVLIPESVTTLRPTSNFIVTPIECMSLPDHSLETLVTIKVEPVDIKEEMVEPDHTGLNTVNIEGSTSPDEFMQSLCDQAMLAESYSSYQPQKSWTSHITAAHAKKLAHSKTNKELVQLASPTCHLEFQKTYICGICDQTFTTNSVYQSHLRKHTKPFVCQFCEKGFSEISSLRKHLTSHSNERPYTCDCCNKRFSHRNFLIVHLRSHTGDKPYACKLCDKTFAQSGHAISHMRSHTKAKPFSCTQCDKSFAERNTLKKHMRTHTGLKPFACKVCNKTFALQDTVKSHMRTHTGEKPYVCVECGKTYSTRGNLRKHMKIHAMDEQSAPLQI